jgi:ABC-2 type transport system ATP-binding protein
MIAPDSGTMSFENRDCTHCPVSFRKELGSAPQNIALYEELNGMDNLKFWGEIHGVPKSKLNHVCLDIAEKVGLSDRLKDTVKTYSGGMKRRLNLAVAILHKPKLLLLDEPTAGVDPQSRNHILEIVRELADQGAMVLYTTHYLEEAENLCDRIGIIDSGRIISEGSVPELCQSVQTGRIASLEGKFNLDYSAQTINEFPDLEMLSGDESRIVVRLEHDEALMTFMKNIFKKDLNIQSLAVKPPSLETVFLILTGKELRD